MAIFRLGMYREAEKQFKSALKQQEMIDTFLYLAKVSIRSLSETCLLRITVETHGESCQFLQECFGRLMCSDLTHFSF